MAATGRRPARTPARPFRRRGSGTSRVSGWPLLGAGPRALGTCGAVPGRRPTHATLAPTGPSRPRFPGTCRAGIPPPPRYWPSRLPDPAHAGPQRVDTPPMPRTRGPAVPFPAPAEQGDLPSRRHLRQLPTPGGRRSRPSSTPYRGSTPTSPPGYDARRTAVRAHSTQSAREDRERAEHEATRRQAQERQAGGGGRPTGGPCRHTRCRGR